MSRSVGDARNVMLLAIASVRGTVDTAEEAGFGARVGVGFGELLRKGPRGLTSLEAGGNGGRVTEGRCAVG
jgi:hypothetical protein